MRVQIYKGTIVTSGSIDTLNVYERAYLVVEDGTIRSIGEVIPEKYKDAPVTDYGRSLLIPAFSDLHIHAPQYHERGVGMDIGHTEMTYEQCERAVYKGAKIITHLFDAMDCWKNHPSSLEIQESSSLIALSFPELYYELIVDSRGIHVKPHAVRLAYRTAGEDRIILVTDATAQETGHDPSKYPPESPKSAEDLNYNTRGQLAGSRLILSNACKNFMRFTGADVRVAFKCASTNPAKALGVDGRVGSILPGRDANILFVDEGFNVKHIYFRGEKL